MTHWHDTMVDRPETDSAVYVTGWTISGLAVLLRSGFSGFRPPLTTDQRHEARIGARGAQTSSW